eukprot:CFRG6485T1
MESEIFQRKRWKARLNDIKERLGTPISDELLFSLIAITSSSEPCSHALVISGTNPTDTLTLLWDVCDMFGLSHNEYMCTSDSTPRDVLLRMFVGSSLARQQPQQHLPPRFGSMASAANTNVQSIEQRRLNTVTSGNGRLHNSAQPPESVYASTESKYTGLSEGASTLLSPSRSSTYKHNSIFTNSQSPVPPEKSPKLVPIPNASSYDIHVDEIKYKEDDEYPQYTEEEQLHSQGSQADFKDTTTGHIAPIFASSTSQALSHSAPHSLCSLTPSPLPIDYPTCNAKSITVASSQPIHKPDVHINERDQSLQLGSDGADIHSCSTPMHDQSRGQTYAPSRTPATHFVNGACNYNSSSGTYTHDKINSYTSVNPLQWSINPSGSRKLFFDKESTVKDNESSQSFTHILGGIDRSTIGVFDQGGIMQSSDNTSINSKQCGVQGNKTMEPLECFRRCTSSPEHTIDGTNVSVGLNTRATDESTHSASYPTIKCTNIIKSIGLIAASNTTDSTTQNISANCAYGTDNMNIEGGQYDNPDYAPSQSNAMTIHVERKDTPGCRDSRAYCSLRGAVTAHTGIDDKGKAVETANISPRSQDRSPIPYKLPESDIVSNYSPSASNINKNMNTEDTSVSDGDRSVAMLADMNKLSSVRPSTKPNISQTRSETCRKIHRHSSMGCTISDEAKHENESSFPTYTGNALGFVDVLVVGKIAHASNSLQKQIVEWLLMNRFVYRGRLYDIPPRLVVVFVSDTTSPRVPLALTDLCVVTVDHDSTANVHTQWKQSNTINNMLWNPRTELKKIHRKCREVEVPIEMAQYIRNVITYIIEESPVDQCPTHWARRAVFNFAKVLAVINNSSYVRQCDIAMAFYYTLRHRIPKPSALLATKSRQSKECEEDSQILEWRLSRREMLIYLRKVPTP